MANAHRREVLLGFVAGVVGVPLSGTLSADELTRVCRLAKVAYPSRQCCADPTAWDSRRSK